MPELQNKTRFGEANPGLKQLLKVKIMGSRWERAYSMSNVNTIIFTFLTCQCVACSVSQNNRIYSSDLSVMAVV